MGALFVVRRRARGFPDPVIGSQTALNRTQQFTSCTTGSIAVGVRFRAMAIELIRLARHDAEQFSEVIHKVAPDFRRHAESIENPRQGGWLDYHRRPAGRRHIPRGG